MRRYLLAVALALFPALALAADTPAPPAPPAPAPAPVAKLSGPRAVEVGAAIVLNPAGSTGDLEFGLASGPAAAPIATLKSDDGSQVIGFGSAPVPGEYQFFVVAWSDPAAGQKRAAHAFAFWTVQVGAQPPPPPEPGPGPGPNPPPAPPPSDPLFAALKTAYAADAGPQKAAQAVQLTALYRVAAATAADPSLATLGDLLAKIRAAAGSLLPATALTGVRAAVGAELAAQLGTNPVAPLDEAARKKAAAQFTRIATLLEALTK
jgi:hypothetical protein